MSDLQMKIDKEKLVELLVERTSMGKEDIENQLEQLIERIRDAAERGKALEIKDFGLFYFDESDKLKFDPAEELSSEISFKYAGMKPVELNPERDTSFDVVNQNDEEVVKDEPEEVPKLEREKEPLFVPGKVDEPKEKEEKKPEPEFVKKQKVTASSTSNSINTVILTLAAIILIAVLMFGYFYYTDTVDSLAGGETSPSIEQEQLEPIPEVTPEMDENPEVIPDMEQDIPDEVTEEAEPQAEIETEQLEEQPIYGLMGSLMEEANDGYSIVIHSFNDEAYARSIAANLSNDGYRVLVSSRMVNADTVWRVSIGQFQTLNGAIQAAEDLPSPYNTQNFVQRIQIN